MESDRWKIEISLKTAKWCSKTRQSHLAGVEKGCHKQDVGVRQAVAKLSRAALYVQRGRA